jgi:putative oxidoreductase
VCFHTNFADPNQTFHFIKNLIMTGGLLQIVANGAGVISVDNRIFKRWAQGGSAVPGSWLNPERI